MAVYCKFGIGSHEEDDDYYICSADQYCCEPDQCCYDSSRYNLPQLWYCWFFVLTGILICSLISGKFCKKRHNVRHVTVASSRVNTGNHHGQQSGANIVHPPPVMGNVWTVFPPGYNTTNIVVTSDSDRFSHPSSTDYPPSSIGSSDGLFPRQHPHTAYQPPPTEGALAPGVSLSYHPSMGHVYPPQPGFNTVIITDTLYDVEPPSYESVVRNENGTNQHPHVVSTN